MKIPPNARIVSTGYAPRKQFVPWHARRQRWSAIVSHPRCGKTVAAVNDLIDACLRCDKPSPRVAYVAPFFAQAKDVAWTYLKHFTAPIPGVRANESELYVNLPGDRRVRLYGADNYDRLRGIYLDAVVLDEYADMDPRAWPEVIRPRLADRLGWAAFIGTAHGRNHFAELFEEHTDDPAWFTLKLPASQTGILPPEELDDARLAMTEDQYLAEFECSFNAAIVGALYARELAACEAQGRICAVPYMPELSVDTWWDLGVRNATTVWFTQNVGREVHVIDYAEFVGDGLPEIVKSLRDRPYVYGNHNAPHDIRVQELGSGRTRIEIAAGLGVRFGIVPDVSVEDGIAAARVFLARCWFDRAKTARGREALLNYRRQFDAKRKVFSAQPLHDWASDAADAFRYLAVGHKSSPAHRPAPPPRVIGVRTRQSTEWMGV